MLDAAHKMLRPETYDCALCSLTHGTLKEKSAWIRFRESVQTPLEFLHKDEFLKAYRSKWLPKYDFPIVLVQWNQTLEIAISRYELENINTEEVLIRRVGEVLKGEK